MAQSDEQTSERAGAGQNQLSSSDSPHHCQCPATCTRQCTAAHARESPLHQPTRIITATLSCGCRRRLSIISSLYFLRSELSRSRRRLGGDPNQEDHPSGERSGGQQAGQQLQGEKCLLHQSQVLFSAAATLWSNRCSLRFPRFSGTGHFNTQFLKSTLCDATNLLKPDSLAVVLFFSACQGSGYTEICQAASPEQNVCIRVTVWFQKMEEPRDGASL